MLRVTGILRQQLTRHVGTFSAMLKTFILTTRCHRTLSVEWLSLGCNTSAASAGFYKLASGAVKSASGIYHKYFLLMCLYFSLFPVLRICKRSGNDIDTTMFPKIVSIKGNRCSVRILKILLRLKCLTQYFSVNHSISEVP